MVMKRPGRVGVMKVTVVALAAVLAMVCWVAVLVVTDVDQDQQLHQAESRASNLALLFEEQIFRQVLSIDQTLRSLKNEWERDPGGFDVATLQRRASAVSDLVSGIQLLDYRGRVVSSTNARQVGADLSGRRYFAAHRASDSLGSLITGPWQSNGTWSLSISRRFNAAHGVFAGAVMADYDLNALMRDMSQADLGSRGMIMLVGRDGLVRAISLHGMQEPGADIAGSPLYRAMFLNPGPSWTGPSGPDGDVRVHAWRAIPGQEMTLVVGLDRASSLVPSETRRREAVMGALAVTILVIFLAMGVGTMIANAAARVNRMDQDRAVLEAANLQLARARELADEKSLQLGTTLAGMSDGLSMVNSELKLVQWNQHFATLAGMPRDTLHVGMPLEAILRIRASNRDLAPEEIDADVAGNMEAARVGTWPTIATETLPDGTVLELRRTRLPDGSWVTLYSDITARKQAEDVQSRAREQAEIAAQEKSRFVAIVSHEIRTPLNVALNSLGLLDGSDLSPAQRKWVETGLLAGESLLGLLNDILDLSRMQVGRMQLRPAPFTLRPLLDGVVEMFRHQALERGVELSVHLAPGVPERLMTDSGRLRQALMNLVNNTAKFAEPGPASIRIGFATMDGSRVLRFAVRDCGPDIPDLDRARLFRPFSQLERAGSTGTGLGLAICQLLANLLGGQIGCDRTANGKEFWLTLPADAMNVPNEAPAVTLASTLPRWLPRTRLLLVEDVPANQMIVATMLRREGHMVDVASSGLEALEKIGTRPYDLVFLDIFMPGIDGPETARRIRQMPGQAATLPLIALTANVSGHDRGQYLASGMNDLVPKPVQRATLLAALAQHVWANRAAPVTPPPAAIEPTARQPGPVVDTVQVESWQKGLRPAVSDALFADCIRQLRDMLEPLRMALHACDRAGVKQAAHAIVGVAGNYGLTRLGQAVRLLGAEPSHVMDVEEAIAQLDWEIAQANDAVQAMTRVEAA